MAATTRGGRGRALAFRLRVTLPADAQPWRAELVLQQGARLEFRSIAELAAFLARLSMPGRGGGLR